MSLIIFPACCIHCREAHKFSLSQLYRRHINVEGHCCLISSPLHIRKWKCAAEKRANPLILLALPAAEARPSLSFVLLFKQHLCLIFGRRARGSSECSILSEMLCDLSVSIRKKRSGRRENHIRAGKQLDVRLFASGWCTEKHWDTHSDICCESNCRMTTKAV